MNPYDIYRDEWQDALADQATAEEFKTFVAMPFRSHFSYRSTEVFSDVIVAAVNEANRRGEAKRKFARPIRVDAPKGAVVITEEIIRGILRSHFFLADLTFENPGVILETGIALGTKPNRQVIAIAQGSLRDLHFDLRNNHVIAYTASGSVAEIASAFIDAAKHFEDQVDHHIASVQQRIGPDSLILLNWYGYIQSQNVHLSLHPGSSGPNITGADAAWRFEAAARELHNRKLLWTDYRAGAVAGGDAFGMHATQFGWAVINRIWPDLRQSDDSQRAALERSSKNSLPLPATGTKAGTKRQRARRKRSTKR